MSASSFKDQHRFLAGQSLLLVRILGIPLYVDYSWFLIFALFTWSLAVGYFPNQFGGWPAALYWALGGIAAVLFFASILAHEIAHSIAAAHFQIPVRGIRLFIFGGVAYLSGEPSRAAADFWIAVIGPLSSLVLAGLFKLLQISVGIFPPLLALAGYLALVNAMVAVFNLVPAFPLDGGRVLRALLWRVMHDFHHATQVAARVGQVLAFYILLAGLWKILSGNLGDGMWLIFLGWFLENAALTQVQRETLRDLLTDRTVAQAMSRNYATIPPDLPLQRLAEAHLLGSGQRRNFIVQQAGAILGVMDSRCIFNVRRSLWPSTTAAQVMQPLDNIRPVGQATPLWSALEAMDQALTNQLPVIEDSQVIGILTREGIFGFLGSVKEAGSRS